MPPRRSARVAELRDPSHNALPPLPLELVWLVFAWLPVDQRLLLNAVCRSWRAPLREPSVWRELDFSRCTRRVTLAMIHAALRCARGQLRVLDLSKTHLPFEAPLLEIAQENAALHTLRLYCSPGALLEASQVDTLLAAAPRLQTLECGVRGEPEAILPLLRKERPTYGCLMLTRAVIEQNDENAHVEVDVLPLAAAAATHEGLRGLDFLCIPLSVAQLQAIVDVALQRQMTLVQLFRCSLGTEHLPQLTRLLASSALRSLEVYNDDQPLIIGDGVLAFCAALRASNLWRLALCEVRLFASLPDGLAVLDALTGHRNIEGLGLLCNQAPSPEAKLAVGQALGRLVAADSALTSLNLSWCSLGDAGVGPLFAALAKNTTLLTLILTHNGISRECAQDVVLPAVRANTSRRDLSFGQTDIPELAEAGQLVHGRQ
jgi:hypothetical protein